MDRTEACGASNRGSIPLGDDINKKRVGAYEYIRVQEGLKGMPGTFPEIL